MHINIDGKKVYNKNQHKSIIYFSENQEEAIKKKMDELRKYSHPDVSDNKLRHGALLALGLKSRAHGE